MIVAVFVVLGLFGLALVLAACFPQIVARLTRDDEEDHDPYNFWGKRPKDDNEDWE